MAAMVITVEAADIMLRHGSQNLRHRQFHVESASNGDTFASGCTNEVAWWLGDTNADLATLLVSGTAQRTVSIVTGGGAVSGTMLLMSHT